MKTSCPVDDAGLLTASGWRIICTEALLAACLAVAALMPSCTTVVPTPAVVPASASFDGAEQNSGIVGVQPDGLFIVTSHLRDRYNALVAVYGREFAPPLSSDSGLSPVGPFDRWTMTPQAMADFATMVQWRRMGRAAR